MIKVTVLYGHPTDPDGFDRYYIDHHLDLAKKIPNLRRIEVARAMSNDDGSSPPYHFLGELWFDSLDDMHEGLASPEGEAAVADTANYATGGFTMLVSEVM
jgi:uncharacterized protein (TIGR02118 family)